jgi:hypothetical protein
MALGAPSALLDLDLDPSGMAVARINKGLKLQSLIIPKPDEQKDSEVHLNVPSHEGEHSRVVCVTGMKRKAGVGMPFADIIELGVPLAGPVKEFSERLIVHGRRPGEAGISPATPLKCHLDQPENVWADILAHQNAAHLAPSGAFQFPVETSRQISRDYQLHLSPLR